MSLAFKQIKVYVKLCSLIAALLLAMVVVIKNYGQRVNVWFLRSFEDVSVGILILCTAVVSLVLWLLLRPALTVHRDMGDLRIEQLERDQRKQQKELMDRLEKGQTPTPPRVTADQSRESNDDEESDVNT